MILDHRDHLIRFGDFFLKILLADSFLFSLPNCLLIVCLFTESITYNLTRFILHFVRWHFLDDIKTSSKASCVNCGVHSWRFKISFLAIQVLFGILNLGFPFFFRMGLFYKLDINVKHLLLFSVSSLSDTFLYNSASWQIEPVLNALVPIVFLVTMKFIFLGLLRTFSKGSFSVAHCRIFFISCSSAKPLILSNIVLCSIRPKFSLVDFFANQGIWKLLFSATLHLQFS